MPDQTAAPSPADRAPAASPAPSATLVKADAPKPNTPSLYTPEGQQKSFAELVTRVAGLGAQAFNRVRHGRSDEPRAAYPEMVARFAGSPAGESVQRMAVQAWNTVPPKARPWVMIGVGALNVALMVYEGYDQHRHPKRGVVPPTAKAGSEATASDASSAPLA